MIDRHTSAERRLGLTTIAFSVLLAIAAARADTRSVQGPEVAVVPAGTFQMGKMINYGYGDIDGPTHKVTIERPFALAKHEVTLGEFRAFVKDTGYVSAGKCNVYKEDTVWFIDPKRNWADPGFPQEENHPVVCVSWRDTQAYIEWLNRKTGRKYRLPSEAEFEYAATVADLGNARSGGALTHDMANFGKAKCCGGETGGKDTWIHTAPVGSFPADKLGLHDIRGNVWEWQDDCYHATYDGAPVDGTARRSCPTSGFHTVRGGSYGDAGEYLSERFRLRGPQDEGYFTVGFRVVQSDVILAFAAASRADDFQPTAAEQERLALMSRPEQWFIGNLQGPRELIDGQLLDPKLQYYLEARRRRTPEEVKRGLDLFHSAEGRVAIRQRLAREWALLTKVTAPMRAVEDRKITGPRGEIPIRIYTPQSKDNGALPILVYFHGGGWLYSGIEAIDRCARLIANEAQAIVISVEYALAPEHPWPAANDDGEAAFLWARANAASLGGNPDMIGVGGDSAGGNIAINISHRQIAAGRPTPLYQLLYYTSTDFAPDYESSRLFGKGYGLDLTFREFMMPLVFQGKGTAEAAVKELARAKLKYMPATIVVTPGFDILRDPAQAFAQRLEREGVAVTYLNYPTLIHGFLQWSGVVADAERAAVDTARLFGTAIRSRMRIVRRNAGRD